MTNEEAFRSAILEAPEDDTPRLVYADWLDDHGNAERADFIRIQCKLAKMARDHPKRSSLEGREQELLQRHGWEWAEAFGARVSQWEFRRGFIESVEMSLETSLDEILGVLQNAPIRRIRDLSQFCHLDGVVEALPHFQRLTGLEFWCLYAFDDELLRRILSSPHLANLRTLVLHHDRNGNLAEENVIVEALSSPHRTNLKQLAVNVDSMWRGPSRNILKAIAGSPYLRQLRSLNLTNAGDEGNEPLMDRETIQVLGRSANLAGLERLDMGQTSFSLEAWDEVLRWPWLSRLKWLRLHYARQVNPPSTMTVAELGNLPHYRQAFDQLVAVVDWETEFLSPWDGNTSWRGLSWEGLRERHLFSMWPYVRRKDYDGLEAAFRKDCCRYAGESAARAVDDLPFQRYQGELARGLGQAVAASARHSDATSIYLRIRPDLQWSGEYHVTRDRVQEPFEPHSSYSYSGPLGIFTPSSFPEAGQVRDRFAERKLLDPGGVLHYLLARTVAAFGRCVSRTAGPLPILFDCMYAVFRM
jgi:uncharacterized protein (TIGR02996 family)